MVILHIVGRFCICVRYKTFDTKETINSVIPTKKNFINKCTFVTMFLLNISAVFIYIIFLNIMFYMILKLE